MDNIKAHAWPSPRYSMEKINSWPNMSSINGFDRVWSIVTEQFTKWNNHRIEHTTNEKARCWKDWRFWRHQRCRKRFRNDPISYISWTSRFGIRNSYQFFWRFLNAEFLQMSGANEPQTYRGFTECIRVWQGVWVFTPCSSVGFLKWGYPQIVIIFFHGFSILNHPAIGIIGVPPWLWNPPVVNTLWDDLESVFQKGFPTSIHCGFLWVTCLISRISMDIPLFYVDTKLSDGLFAWTSMSFLLKNPSFLMKSPGFLQFSGRYPQRPPCPRHRPSVSLFSGERVFRGESQWVEPDDRRGCPVTGGRFRGMGCCKRFFLIHVGLSENSVIWLKLLKQ